jgi:hypothetical protein
LENGPLRKTQITTNLIMSNLTRVPLLGKWPIEENTNYKKPGKLVLEKKNHVVVQPAI